MIYLIGQLFPAQAVLRLFYGFVGIIWKRTEVPKLLPGIHSVPPPNQEPFSLQSCSLSRRNKSNSKTTIQKKRSCMENVWKKRGNVNSFIDRWLILGYLDNEQTLKENASG